MSKEIPSTMLDVAVANVIEAKRNQKKENHEMTASKAMDILTKRRDITTESEIDKYVSDLILARAFMDKQRASHLGVAAYRTISPQLLKPNTRFLTSIIKSTDGHNKALLARNALKRQKSLSPQPTEKRDVTHRSKTPTTTAKEMDIEDDDDKDTQIKRVRGRGDTGSHRMDQYFKSNYDPKRDIFDEYGDSFDWVDLLDEKGQLPWCKEENDLILEKKKRKLEKKMKEEKSSKKHSLEIHKQLLTCTDESVCTEKQKDKSKHKKSSKHDKKSKDKIKQNSVQTLQHYPLSEKVPSTEKKLTLMTKLADKILTSQSDLTREGILPEKCPW